VVSAVDLTPFRELYPFRPNYLDTPHGRMHYVDEGPRDAPVLLMLHGNPTWSFYYRNLVLAFRNTHRVVVPDHLGCGLSDKPSSFEYTLRNHIANVRLLVDTLNLERITLVVHDWGGAIGMGYAVTAPDRVKSFVVFNTAAFLATRMPISIFLCRIPGFGALAIRGLNAFAKGALKTCVMHRDRLSDAVRAGYLAPYDSWSHRVANLKFVQDIPMRPSHPTYAMLEEIEARLHCIAHHPMLIVWGAKDFVFNDHFLGEWRGRFPNAEVHRLDDAGHYVVEDAHERIVPWMSTFLAQSRAAERQSA
jgi:haloalkane dehalogenase